MSLKSERLCLCPNPRSRFPTGAVLISIYDVIFEGKTGNKGVQEYDRRICISVSIGIKSRIRIRVRLCKWTVIQDDAKRPWKMFGFHAQGCVHLRHVIQMKSVGE